MKSIKKSVSVVLVFAVCMGTAFAEHKINKKKKMTVTVEQDGNCRHGISVSDASWGDRQLCTDYPPAAAAHFQKFVGSTVEIEAQWTYAGDPKSTTPIAISKVFKVGREKVYDPCAVSKVGLFAGMAMVAGGADPQATAAMLTQSCTDAMAAEAADSGDDDQ